MNASLTLLCAGLAVAAIAVSAAAAQDMATSSKHTAVVLDNARVRVLEVNLAPGESTGMHSHGDNLVVFISGGKATQTMADGSTKAIDRKAGEVTWSDPVTHDTTNTGKAAVRSLVIELK